MPQAMRLRRRLQRLRYHVFCESRQRRKSIAGTLRNFGISWVHESAPPLEYDPLLDGHPDVFVWDWDIPNLPALTKLCRSGGVDGPAVIVLDSQPSTELVAMVIACGAHGVIAKPYSANGMLSHIAHAVHRKSNAVVAI